MPSYDTIKPAYSISFTGLGALSTSGSGTGTLDYKSPEQYGYHATTKAISKDKARGLARWNAMISAIQTNGSIETMTDIVTVGGSSSTYPTDVSFVLTMDADEGYLYDPAIADTQVLINRISTALATSRTLLLTYYDPTIAATPSGSSVRGYYTESVLVGGLAAGVAADIAATMTVTRVN